MANNEDYLDALLREAEQNNDPNSAINKVRELNESINSSVEIEEAMEETDTSDSENTPVEDTPSVEDLLSDLTISEDSDYANADIADLLSGLTEESGDSSENDDISALIDVVNLVGDASLPVSETDEETADNEVTDGDAEIASLLDEENTETPALDSNLDFDSIIPEELQDATKETADEESLEDVTTEEINEIPEEIADFIAEEEPVNELDEISRMFESNDSGDDFDIEKLLSDAENFANGGDEAALKVEEITTEVVSAEEVPTLEMPSEEISSEEVPVEESGLEELIAEEVPVYENIAEETLPIEESTIEEVSLDENPVEELAAEESIMEEIPAEEVIQEEVPAEETTVYESTSIDDLFGTEAVPYEETIVQDIEAGDHVNEESLEDVSTDNEEQENTSMETSETDENAEDQDNRAENASEEDRHALSQDEIEELIEKANHVDEPEEPSEVDINDIGAMEGDLGIFDKNDMTNGETGDAELDEISSLLNSLESNEVTEEEGDGDILDLLNEAVIKSEEEDSIEEARKEKERAEAEYAEQKKREEKEKKKLKLFKKKKKEPEIDPETGEPIPETEKKPKTKFGKFIQFITAEEEDSDEAKIDALDPDAPIIDGFEDVPGENKETLDEMDREEAGKKGKKKKKDKKKKGKKDKQGASTEGEGEEGEEASEEKPKKLKKVKPDRKPLELDIDTGKPLSKRNIKLVSIMAVSLLILIILFIKFIPGIIINSQARTAYYAGDYETTYNAFYGEKLSDSDKMLFEKSAIILKVSHKYDAFIAYNKMDMQVEALDQLLQAVEKYEAWLVIAESLSVETEFNAEYSKIIGALGMYYNLSESDAREIISLPTDLEYSLKVESIVNGTAYIDPNEPLPGIFIPPVEEEETIYEDILPEEE